MHIHTHTHKSTCSRNTNKASLQQTSSQMHNNLARADFLSKTHCIQAPSFKRSNEDICIQTQPHSVHALYRTFHWSGNSPLVRKWDSKMWSSLEGPDRVSVRQPWSPIWLCSTAALQKQEQEQELEHGKTGRKRCTCEVCQVEAWLEYVMRHSQPSKPVKVAEHAGTQGGDVVLTEQPAEKEEHHSLQFPFSLV